MCVYGCSECFPINDSYEDKLNRLSNMEYINIDDGRNGHSRGIQDDVGKR